MKSILALGLLIAGIANGATPPVNLDLFEWRPLMSQLLVTSGPWQGAFLNAPYGDIDWYFSNIAMVHFVQDDPAMVRAYLECYLNHVDPAYHIIYRYNPSTAMTLAPDSTDSYAATFLSAAVAYMRATGDQTWWNSRRALIQAIASDNLIGNTPDRDANGFTLPLRRVQGLSGPGVAYLMDQTEVYQGLRDYGEYLQFLKDPYAAVVLTEVARLGPAIHKYFFDSAHNNWLPADQPGFSSATWYPDLACQVYPDLYDVRGNDPVNDTARLLRGFEVMNAGAPTWSSAPVDAVQPWMVMGYYAALRQRNFPLAQQMMQNVFANFLVGSAKNGGHLQVYDIGYIQSTIRLTEPRPRSNRTQTPQQIK